MKPGQILTNDYAHHIFVLLCIHSESNSSPRHLPSCPLSLFPVLAEDTPLTSLALAWLWEKAGGPKGVVNVVPTSRELVQEVGNVLTTEEAVRKVSFTGSTAVGKQLLRQAASTVKRTSMELGGNAPFVVRGQMMAFELSLSGSLFLMHEAKFSHVWSTWNKIPAPHVDEGAWSIFMENELQQCL